MDEPKRLEHYEILGRIGEGGMGVVYRARDTRLGRMVALKVLPESFAADEQRSRRFEREARIVSGLSHPGIATLYDIGHEGDRTFFAMELIEGRSLRRLLEWGPLPVEQVVTCGLQIAEALAAAHRQGVVHRDLKPENLMAADSGYYKVLDFGVARLEPATKTDTPTTRTPTRTWSTSAGALLGTVTYMSPEQLVGKEVDGRSDIFSLGVVLHELLAGKPPFDGANEIAVAHEILSGDPQPLGKIRPGLPAALERIVGRCLRKNPEERYATAQELAEALRDLQWRTLTHRGNRLGAALAAARPRRPLWLAAIATLAIGGLVVAALAVQRARSVEEPAEPAAPQGPSRTALGAPVPPHPGGQPAFPAGRWVGRPRVVVAFFENATGSAEAEQVRRGLPDMLTTDLSQSPDLEMIATQRLHDLLVEAGREPTDVIDRSTAAELARWAGADLVISGSVFLMGETWRLDAQAYDTRTGAVIAAHKVEGTELLPMVNDLTLALQQALSGAAAGRKTPRWATEDPEAYRAFIEGKSAYDRLLDAEAIEALERAVDLDPEFAPARMTLALSELRSGRREGGLEQLEQALGRQESLPEPQRLLALGLAAFLVERDPGRGNELMRDLVERFPENAEPFVWWARALEENGAGPMEVIPLLGKAVKTDPRHVWGKAALAEHMARVVGAEEARAMLGEAVGQSAEAVAAKPD